MNPPVSCQACQKKICVETGELCKAAELWVNQDAVGQNSIERLGNSSSDFGDGLTFLDLSSFYHAAPVEPDPETSREAWGRLKSLRLKPKHLEILRLFYKDGKRLCDCALELKIPDQSAWARKKKAKEQVADRLYRLESWIKIRYRKFPTENSRIICRLFFRDLRSRYEIAEEVGCTIGCVGKNIRKILKLFG